MPGLPRQLQSTQGYMTRKQGKYATERRYPGGGRGETVRNAGICLIDATNATYFPMTVTKYAVYRKKEMYLHVSPRGIHVFRP